MKVLSKRGAPAWIMLALGLVLSVTISRQVGRDADRQAIAEFAEVADGLSHAAQIVVSLQSVVSRSIDPLQPGVITVGSIRGGSKHNIIGDRVDMQLTVRSNDPAVRLQLLDGIDRVARGVAVSMGVPETLMPQVIRSKTESTPPTVNHAPTVDIVRDAFTRHFGADRVIAPPPEVMGAEDFAYFVTPESGVKGVYFNVGGTPEQDLATAPSHHSPFFKIEPEPAIKTGIEAMVRRGTTSAQWLTHTRIQSKSKAKARDSRVFCPDRTWPRTSATQATEIPE